MYIIRRKTNTLQQYDIVFCVVFYAPNFEKVGDILVSASPCVCVCVCVCVCLRGIEISSWNFMYGFFMEK